MRVLIVTHMALPHVGGLEVVVDYETRALLATGHEVTLVTSDGTGKGRNPQYDNRATIIRVPAWHALERRFGLPYPLFSPALATVLWQQAALADLVHVHGFMFMSSPIAAAIARLRRKPVILTDHGGIQHFDSRLKTVLARIGAETVGRFTVLCSNRLVTFNTRIARTLERLSRRMTKCEFIPNPVDRTLFQPPTEEQRSQIRATMGWSPNRQKVLFVGRLIEEKGVPALLECSSPDYDLVFCGAGDPSLLGPLPRAGIEYLPPRPQSEVVRLYQAADLVVVPSKPREGFPLVVQEALCCGAKVLLGFDEGFAPYSVIPGLTLCDVDPRSLRKAIGEALAVPHAITPACLLDEFCPRFETWIARLYPQETVTAFKSVSLNRAQAGV